MPTITPQEIGYIGFFIISLLGMIQFLITQFTKLLKNINSGYEAMRIEAIKERENWYQSKEKTDLKLGNSLDQLTDAIRQQNNRHRDSDR